MQIRPRSRHLIRLSAVAVVSACVALGGSVTPAAAAESSSTSFVGDDRQVEPDLPPADPLPTTAAEQAENEPQTVGAPLMVIGDSISYLGHRYQRSGPERVWWSYVAAQAGIDPEDVAVDALPGSGFGRVRCESKYTPFPERLDAVRQAKPEVIVVAGGRNDVTECRAGRRITLSAASAEAHVAGYLRALAAVADEIGVDRADVFVMNHWGTSGALGQPRVTAAMKKHAGAQGFSYVRTPALMPAHTSDTTHPNAAGSKWIADQVIADGRLVARLTSDSASRPVSAQRVSGVSSRGFTSRARERFWGRSTTDAQNYVAYRLTHGASTRFPRGVTGHASSWREPFAADGARFTTVPRPGYVAFWSTGPSSTGGRTTGHVAMVERAYATAVDVSEWDGRTFRTMRYRGQDLPDGYLKPATASGSPAGALTSVAMTSRSRVRVTGYAADTDAYDRGTRLRVVVTQRGRNYSSPVLGATRFGFSRTAPVTGLRAGPAVVRVYAYDAPRSKGASTVWLGTRSVTVR